MSEAGEGVGKRDVQLRFLLATGRQGFPSRSDSVARLHLVRIDITTGLGSSFVRRIAEKMVASGES